MKEKKVIIFPHAGAGIGFFNSFKDEFKKTDVFVIQYPGREDKYEKNMPDTIDELADVIFDEYKCLFDGQFVFWGHSMGSIVAYEVAKRCERNLNVVPIVFFSSGSSAPCCGGSERVKNAVKSHKDFEKLLDVYGGISDELRNDRDFCEYFFPIILGDLKMISNYCDEQLVKLRCPIMLMEGLDDDVSIDRWRLYLSLIHISDPTRL